MISDPLIWMLTMCPAVPIDITNADRIPIRDLFAAEVIARAHIDRERARAMRAAHDRAIRGARRG